MLLVQVNADAGAFACLVQRWEMPIKRLCKKVTGDVHLADDLCQETFVRIFNKRAHYRPGARFSTWLWRIALNLCYSALRCPQSKLDRWAHCGDLEESNSNELGADALTPDQLLIATEEATLIRSALSSLPVTLRRVLVLRYCDGMTFREIAEELNIPATTAASRCAAALTKLTRILEPNVEKQ